jgi:cytochrome c-type biogenesis protein CcmH/NrfF
VVETKLSKIPLAGQDPVDESKAMQIAERFDCSCGTCGDLSLDTCACPTAVKEREFIRKSVEQRMTSDQIIAEVNKVYGHIKSRHQFAVPPLSSFGSSAGIDTNSGEN